MLNELSFPNVLLLSVIDIVVVQSSARLEAVWFPAGKCSAVVRLFEWLCWNNGHVQSRTGLGQHVQWTAGDSALTLATTKTVEMNEAFSQWHGHGADKDRKTSLVDKNCCVASLFSCE